MVILSQDSLYWFDMSTVIDKVPKTPIIFDKHFGKSNLEIIDSLRNYRISTRDGFRLQIYESSSANQVKLILDKYKNNLSDSMYIIFEAPLYKLHYGNYVTKNDADLIKKTLIKKGYKNIWIVKSRITQYSAINQDNDSNRKNYSP